MFTQGTLHKDPNNVNEAKVFIYDENTIQKLGFNSLLISGQRNLNRAIHLDTVAVKILPQNEWVEPSNVYTDDLMNDLITIGDDSALRNSENFESANLDLETKKAKHSEATVPCGEIVGIVRSKNARFCGFIQPISALNIEQKNLLAHDSSKYLFVPLSKRIPKIIINMQQFSEFQKSKIVVSIDSWPVNSIYPKVITSFYSFHINLCSWSLREKFDGIFKEIQY